MSDDLEPTATQPPAPAAPDPALLGEAFRRGLLPPDVAGAYQEAQRRGLIAGATPSRDAKAQADEQPAEMGGYGKTVTGLANNLLGGLQRTTPVTKGLNGEANYGVPLGEYRQSDSGPIFFGPDRHAGSFDPEKHVVLLDPDTGKQMVYQRNEQTNEGLLSSAGHVLGIGAIAPSNIGMAAAREAPTAAQSLLKDFDETGVTPTLPAVSQSRTAQIAQNTLRETPGAAGLVEQRAKDAVAQTGEAAQRLAGEYGAAANEKQAGDIIQQAVQDFANKAKPKTGALTADEAIAAPTRATSLSQKAGALFDRVAGYFKPDDQIQLTNTLQALKGPVDRFPTSPELGRILTNPKLQQYFDILSPREEAVPSVAPVPFNRTGLTWSDAEAPGGASWMPSASARGMEAGADAANSAMPWRDPALAPTGDVPPFMGAPARTEVTGGSLTFPEVKELRSTIGRMLDGSQLVSDIPRGDLKAVYGALSQDIRDAAAAKGQGALNAFTRANQYYDKAMDRVDQLQSLIGKNGQVPAEGAYGAVLRAAQDGTRGDISKLWSVRRAMPDDQWGNIAAATLRTMGKPTAGAAGEADFSVSTFLTNYSKLSDAGKNVIFNSTGMGPLRAQLDRLVNVVGAQKNVARLANSSGTGRVGIASGIYGSAIGTAMSGHPILAALGLAAQTGGANLAARAMMSPAFVRWLYAGPKTANLAPWVASLDRLDQIATNDAALKPVAQYLRQSLGQTPAYAGGEGPTRRNRP